MPQAAAPPATAAPKTKPPQSVEVTIWVPSDRTTSGITGQSLGASANLGHYATARCTGWRRHLDGAVSLVVLVEVTTPPGTLPALTTGGRP